MDQQHTRSVSLVLGSGGARGLAHIGVIRWLDEHEYEIKSIAGTSMGALIGGIYATGKLDTYEKWVRALTRVDVLRLLDVSLSSGGLIKGDRIINVLRGLIGDSNIENLAISFTAVATDIHAGKEIWLNRGPLFDAIRASMAIPTIFTPVEYGNRVLLDGGLVNPIPIAPTLNDKTDLTIAVNLSAKPDGHLSKPITKANLSDDINNRYHKKIVQFIESLSQKFNKPTVTDMGFFDILSQSMDTMQTSIARFKLAAYTPDIIIDIPRNISTFYEFHRADELIQFGYEKTEEVFKNLSL